MRFYRRVGRRGGVSVGPFGALLLGLFWVLLIGLLIRVALAVVVIAAGFAVWFASMLALGWIYHRWQERRRSQTPTQRQR